MQLAKRLKGINEYYFSGKLREIDQMNKEGKNVINLGIGSPDLPPHPDVIATLHAEAIKPTTHAYQNYKGSPVLRSAMADWYKKYYGVYLNPVTEILPLMGSKEGIMHICMTYLNEGDVALVPNPGYPTYAAAVSIAGADILHYDLKNENNWEPDFDALEAMDLTAVKLMFVNFPHMPTGQLPSAGMFQRLVNFARHHNILLVHDNPYSFILNDKPCSLLATNGAMEVALELNSLSKSHNMAGWRVGMLAGAEERINEVLKFKTNMDSGMFLPLQLAAAKALQLDTNWYSELNNVYRKRQAKMFELVELLNCSYNTAQAGMFVWATIPTNYSDGFALSDEVLHKANVFITPGGIFGSNGNNYVRLSLCCTEEKIEEAINRIKNKAK